MKKSNKILLGGLLSMIFLITGVHITLLAKYKTGQYTMYEPNKGDQSLIQDFPGLSTVSIHNCIAIVEFGDVLSVDKTQDRLFQFVQEGDSLIVTGQNEKEDSGSERLRLTLPQNAKVFVTGSIIYFEASQDSVIQNSSVFLNQSDAYFGYSGKSMKFDQLIVNALGKSFVRLSNSVSAGFLKVGLIKSSMECGKGEIGQLIISTDSVSSINLSSKHLLKANISSGSQ